MHIREIDVIQAGKDAGLTDNKVCSFSATHTALRFVTPLSNGKPSEDLKILGKLTSG